MYAEYGYSSFSQENVLFWLFRVVMRGSICGQWQTT